MAAVTGEREQIDLAKAEGFVLGPLRIDPPTLQVTAGGRTETLEPRIMQVLVALYRRRGEVVSREELTDLCWEGRVVGQDSINRCIGRLRRLSEAEGGFAIETIARVGYRLMETEPAAPPADAAKADAPPPEPASRRAPWRRWWALAAVIVLAVAATSAHLLLNRPAPPGRVAVLPLQPLGSNEEAKVFAAAVAGQIVGVLNDNQVQAVAPDEIASLRGENRERAARRLGVDFLLDGTVQKTPAGLAVVAHIERTSSRATLWTGTFDAAGAETSDFKAQVAARVVDEIKGALEAATLGDDAAVAAFLKAKEYGREGGKTATALRRDQYRIVTAREPAFARGHSGLAWTSSRLMQFVAPAEADGLRIEARRAAERALALDPRNGEAYLALAMLAPPRDYAGQERLLRRGMAADPDDPTLNSTLAALLEDVGRFADAMPLYERAAMLDPLSPRKNAGLAAVQAITGNSARARATIAKARTLWPDNPSIWSVELLLATYGDITQARTLVAEARRRSWMLEPDFFAALDAYLDALAAATPQNRVKARQAILAAVAARHLDPTGTIEILTRLGEVDAAFATADKAYFGEWKLDLYARPNTQNLFRPSTAAMRADQRFLPLVERLGLVAYWRAGSAPDFCRSETVAPCPDLKKNR